MPRPFANIGTKPNSFGTIGAAVTPSNTTIVDAKFVEVTSIAGGTVLQIQPAENQDGDWITYTGVSVGFVPKFAVKRVGAATTCSVVASLN